MFLGLAVAAAGGLYVYGRLTDPENVDTAVDILMGDQAEPPSPAGSAAP
jgi:hypothetical protein